MAYRLVQPHPDDVQEQIEALPVYARASFDDALDAILDLPWDAPPLKHANPSGLRVGAFADDFGLIVFQVVDFEAIQVERIVWLG